MISLLEQGANQAKVNAFSLRGSIKFFLKVFLMLQRKNNLRLLVGTITHCVKFRVRVSESEVLDKIIDDIDFLRFNVG
jgi:hypothetical protein